MQIGIVRVIEVLDESHPFSDYGTKNFYPVKIVDLNYNRIITLETIPKLLEELKLSSKAEKYDPSFFHFWQPANKKRKIALEEFTLTSLSWVRQMILIMRFFELCGVELEFKPDLDFLLDPNANAETKTLEDYLHIYYDDYDAIKNDIKNNTEKANNIPILKSEIYKIPDFPQLNQLEKEIKQCLRGELPWEQSPVVSSMINFISSTRFKKRI